MTLKKCVGGGVAQACSLLFRRLSVGSAARSPGRPEKSERCGFQIRDTAECNSALRGLRLPSPPFTWNHRNPLISRICPFIEFFRAVAENVSFQPKSVRGMIPLASSRLGAFALDKPRAEAKARRSLAPLTCCLGGENICVYLCPSVVKTLVGCIPTYCIPAGYRGFPPFLAQNDIGFPPGSACIPAGSAISRLFFVFFYFCNPDSTEGNEGGSNHFMRAGNPDKPACTRLNPDKPTSVFFGEGTEQWQGNKRQRNDASDSPACFRAVSGTFSGFRQLSAASRHLINPKSTACRHLAPPIAACRRIKFFSAGKYWGRQHAVPPVVRTSALIGVHLWLKTFGLPSSGKIHQPSVFVHLKSTELFA
jgi:hypothetical protein